MSIEIKDLKIGQIVDYGFYFNVTFLGESVDGKYVNMRDKKGNCKQVFKDLFEKYGRPNESHPL